MAKRKGITTGETRAAKNINTAMGTILSPMNVLQPGDPGTRLYANEDT